jgi:hypothetical protein
VAGLEELRALGGRALLVREVLAARDPVDRAIRDRLLDLKVRVVVGPLRRSEGRAVAGRARRHFRRQDSHLVDPAGDSSDLSKRVVEASTQLLHLLGRTAPAHPIRQQHEVAIADRVDPERCAGESGMPKRFR